MEPADLLAVEDLATKLYQTTNPRERQEADRALAPFTTNPEYIRQCRFILENSQNPFAIAFAGFCIDKLIGLYYATFDQAVIVDIRDVMVNTLLTRVGLPTYSAQLLSNAACAITRIGWLDIEALHGVVERVSQFNTMSPQHCALSLAFLNNLVLQMNQPPTARTLSRHRRISGSFRDRQLLMIFNVGLGVLAQLLEDQSAAANHLPLAANSIALIKSCLSFDFIGTALEDSSDDAATVQIPDSWRPVIQGRNVVGMLFAAYGRFPPAISSVAMESLVCVASFRRTFFGQGNDVQRFAATLLQGSYEVLFTGRGLDHEANFHEVCRLLARIKISFQIGEIAACDICTDWMDAVFKFSFRALTAWQWNVNSAQYILMFWNRLAQSVQYNSRLTLTQQLTTLFTDVAKAYITSRLESVAQIAQNPLLENPLENDEAIAGELETLASLIRYQYEPMVEFLVQLLDPLIARLQAMLMNWTGAPAMQAERQLLEGQAAWLAFIVGKLIGARVHSHTNDGPDMLDGDLAARMIQIASLTDSTPHLRCTEELQLGLLCFMQHLRKMYVAELTQRTSKIFVRLGERVGISDQLTLVGVLAGRLVRALKSWSDSERVLTRTLDELRVIASGYSSGRLFAQLEISQSLIKSFTPEVFPFLDRPSSLKLRSLFAFTLTRLVFSDEDEREATFDAFIAPLAYRLDQLLALPSIESYRMPGVHFALVSAFRDLAGVCLGCVTKKQYAFFFEWWYAKYVPVLLRTLEANAHVPAISTPALRFVSELVFNRTGRCQFDIASANGILLFRELSRVMSIYGNFATGPMATTQTTNADKYAVVYKGVLICMVALRRGLAGQYVNFGVFTLYGDDALQNALKMFLKMMLAIPVRDLVDHPKLCIAFVEVLEYFFLDQLASFVDVTFEHFYWILGIMNECIRTGDVKPAGMMCTNLENLCVFLFRQLHSTKPVVLHPFTRYATERPELLRYTMLTLLRPLIAEESSLSWSLARPLLGLILLDEKFFADYTAQLIATQPVERRAELQASFAQLMHGIERTAATKNRDKFSQNVAAFRRQVVTLSEMALPVMPNPFEEIIK